MELTEATLNDLREVPIVQSTLRRCIYETVVFNISKLRRPVETVTRCQEIQIGGANLQRMVVLYMNIRLLIYEKFLPFLAGWPSTQTKWRCSVLRSLASGI